MVFNRKPDPVAASAPRPVASQPVTTLPAANVDVPYHSGNDAESIIGNDLSIEGQSITIRCQGSLRVNGNIQADLHSKKLIVGESAVITGSITATDVAVHGRVEGSIYGSQVVLHQSAHVEGDIHSLNLAIESGASFDGRSRRVANASEISPQLAASGAKAGPSASPAQALFTPGVNRVTG